MHQALVLDKQLASFAFAPGPMHEHGLEPALELEPAPAPEHGLALLVHVKNT